MIRWPTLAKSRSGHHPGRLLFVLTQLWQATFRFQGADTLGGYTLAQVIWYLVLTEAFITSRVAFARKIDTDVRTGDLAYALVRPGGYVSAHFGAYLAERLVRFAFALLVGGVFALLSVGPIPVGPVRCLSVWQRRWWPCSLIS